LCLGHLLTMLEFTMHFYTRTLRTLLRKGLINPDDQVLVCCGGPFDIQTLNALGFRNVTISNLDTRRSDTQPYAWSYQDVEQLSFADAAFDWVLVHDGLHHCGSPHKGLVEMYRVARKGCLVIEARDSLIMRVAAALGLTPWYEVEAVTTNGWIAGGLRNGPVPNFIYRWTEREVRKTLESAYPHEVNDVQFFYGMRDLSYRIDRVSWPRRLVTQALYSAAWLFQRIFPRQCNSFGFALTHTGRFKEWMTPDGTAVRRD
jgi:ubiquinone/menaquinone biosynthesis C-methylase UbiE